MRKIFSVLILILLLTTAIFFVHKKVYSDELDDISKKISELSSALSSSKQATAPFLTQLANMKTQLDGITNQVANTEADIATKKKIINQGYIDLEKQKNLFNKTVRAYYIKNYLFSPLLIFLSSADAQDATRLIAYQKKGSEDDKAVITNIALKIVDLEERKAALEEEDARLQVVKQKLAAEKADVQKLVDGAVAYQQTLSGQIAQLSAKQQQLIAQKLGSLNIPLFAYSTQGGCSSDISPYKDPGFSGTKFALFTYGVPNRVGLNQYGAWGRAKNGQDSDAILHAYYNFDGYQNMNATIKVNDGNGYDTGNIIWSGSLEDYVKRIWEVPDSWTDHDLAALKAQAIAARSYVLAETDNGNKSICANTHCQVFQTNEKGGNWGNAVGQTAGQVMVQGGKPITAYFSSTHGGYMYSSGDIGWSATSFTKSGQDTNGSINSFSDLNNNAYDKDSPWFYCDWGSRSQYNKTAWLKSDEIADIVNSILLVQADSSTDPHILQTDKSDPDTWNEDRVKQELNSHNITPFNNISSARVDADFGSGRTTRIYFSGDAGSADFDATTFKKYFNLRAPSNINIVGPLFNVEKQ